MERTDCEKQKEDEQHDKIENVGRMDKVNTILTLPNFRMKGENERYC